MNRISAWRFNRKLDKLRLEGEYRAAVAARPCYEEYTYSTSIGGPVECGAHGGTFSHCPNRDTRKD